MYFIRSIQVTLPKDHHAHNPYDGQTDAHPGQEKAPIEEVQLPQRFLHRIRPQILPRRTLDKLENRQIHQGTKNERTQGIGRPIKGNRRHLWDLLLLYCDRAALVRDASGVGGHGGQGGEAEQADWWVGEESRGDLGSVGAAHAQKGVSWSGAVYCYRAASAASAWVTYELNYSEALVDWKSIINWKPQSKSIKPVIDPTCGKDCVILSLLSKKRMLYSNKKKSKVSHLIMLFDWYYVFYIFSQFVCVHVFM